MSDLRHGLLNHPDVIERLVELADLRERWRRDPHRPLWEWPPLRRQRVAEAGAAYWQLVGLTAEQLDGHLSQSDLDHFASVIRERLAVGIWGEIVPVGTRLENLGRGGDRQRVRTVTDETVNGAVDAIARQLNPDRRRPNAGPSANARRKWRHRMRRLADS